MPFTFIDIEKKQSQKIIHLFFTLVVFYFAGMILIYCAFKLSSLLVLFLHSPWYIDYHIRAEAYRILPRWEAILILLTTSFIAVFVHWTFSIKNMIKKILDVIGAKPIDTEDRYHLLLKNIIDEVSIATGGIKIEPYVVPSRYLNAFALSDFHGRSVIGITEGLLIKLNRNQLEGVIAHEAAHLVWGDCLLATVSCSIASVYAGLFRSSLDPYNPLALTLKSLPVMFVISIMRFLTLFLNTWISRVREIRADATAVRLTRNPLSLAEPLYLISKNWRGNFLPSAELSPIFIVSPHEKKLEESYGLFADLFTTHPPIKQRLDILLHMAHINYTILESNTKEKLRTQAEIPISSSETENEKIWYALNGKNWQGPFCLKELIHLKYLGPFTWITKAHDMKVKSAFEYKEINTLFKNRQSCDLRIHTCPACNQNLERVYYEGIPIWRCTSCKGHLVDKDRLLRIISRENTLFSDEVKEKAKQLMLNSIKRKAKYTEVSKSSLKCSCCENVMHMTLYSAIYPYRVEIDTCENCNLFWLDQKKLELIQYIIEVLY